MISPRRGLVEPSMGYFCCFGGEIRENKNNNKNGPKNKSKIIMHYNLCLILSRHMSSGVANFFFPVSRENKKVVFFCRFLWGY